MSETGKASGLVRMRDVARMAGVSTMTVSRALSDPSKVSVEVRERINAAVQAAGYLPNRLAGSLSSRRSTLVGLIVPNIDNSLYSTTIKAVSEVLRQSGHQLMIADCGYGSQKEEALIGAFLAQQVAGLILHNATHTDHSRAMIRRAGVPVVEIGNLPADPLDMVVSYSNHEAARAMTLHLARLGYRRIALVTLPARDNDRTLDRQRGYRAALAEARLAEDPQLVVEMPPGLDSGAETVARLVEADAPADAIFFAGDVLAVGALLECQRRGWAVPGRVAIAAFDNLELMRHLMPGITTLRLPRAEIGRRGAEILLDRIQGRSTERRAVDLRFEIVQRGST
ncbi:LacI family DNA-binding transcriptional regulator [Roseomonas sp. E05]|uniref:LacI family DNA-binding transcriptional regulator n=1 Tax=Roseomonas sp. E05 TaxID=3046310 RepID=UPI0024BBAAE7|nr:LacI family DNA-binding transcriptional regulator [Roseomonas sp. E05]MDJ0388732.1 LacI family DNA-binding transcriptional regulator [Roseomonas sp. E05]